jgi:GNAT superfamily N-acetyltransferase
VTAAATPHTLLEAYDAQLRREAELTGASDVTVDGPLVRGIFDRGGFVSYRDLDGLTGSALDELIERTIAYFRDETAVPEFEWKTRGHDAPADLAEHLMAAGLTPDPEETVMMGEAAALAVPVALPEGVTVRRIDRHSTTFLDDARRSAAMQIRVFGGGPSSASLIKLLSGPDDLTQAWIAEADGEAICAGRLEIVPGTEFAGLWGGGTLEPWRGRGIYRALVSARAGWAVERGVRYLQSDCTPMSRPILERSGLSRVTTTTPFMWRRSPQAG